MATRQALRTACSFRQHCWVLYSCQHYRAPISSSRTARNFRQHDGSFFLCERPTELPSNGGYKHLYASYPHQQEPADMSKDRPPGVLASKFTSEKLSTNDAGASATIQFGSVDPAVRPAGLTLRTPTSSHTSSTESRAATPSTQRQGSNPERNPVRTTVAWRPAPLLCKRLNVPVPSPSAGLDWARKAMAHGSQGASATSENPVLAPLNKFVPDSSVVRQIKVGSV